jgi:uncharacterized glyoxalase superfamily protein PhnB
MIYPKLAINLRVPDPAAALTFYATAFGATERCRLTDPRTGTLGHAEFTLDDALLTLSPGEPTTSPSTQILLNCPDVAAAFGRATAAGAEILRPLKTEFHGHRCGSLRDPFGHEWMLFQDLEDLTAEEMQTRWNEKP